MPALPRLILLSCILLATGADACQTLQSLIDQAPAGGVVYPPPGIYRETVYIHKPLTIMGPGVELRGSDVWTRWQALGGGQWMHPGAPALPEVMGQCRPGTSRCHWPEQVFIDGEPLRQVEHGPGPGEFATSGPGGLLTIGTDPTGRLVEVTTRWIGVEIHADHVTLDGVSVTHGGGAVYMGAVLANGRSNVTIRHGAFTHQHSQGVAISDTTNLTLEHNTFAYNGMQGVGGGGNGIANLVVRGNQIYGNNTEDFEPGHSAGGVKVALVRGGSFLDNTVMANGGPGLWCDVDCQSVVYQGNTIAHNEHAGIFYELSDGCQITDNRAWNNGWGFYGWCYGANILIASSSTCNVQHNTVAWGPKQIVALSQHRPPYHTALTNVYLANNIMVSDRLETDQWLTGWCQDFGDPLYDAEAENSGSGNLFYVMGEGDPAAFGWDNQLMTLPAFNATSGGGGGSRYLASAEKDYWLGVAGIPTSPPPHPSGGN